MGDVEGWGFITVALQPGEVVPYLISYLGHEVLDAGALHHGSPVGGIAVCKVASRWNAGMREGGLICSNCSLSGLSNLGTPFDVGLLPLLTQAPRRGTFPEMAPSPRFPRDFQRVPWLARTWRHSGSSAGVPAGRKLLDPAHFSVIPPQLHRGP